ncbi:hypothetical protein NCG89_01910 [Spongiibacter taiwanensis]|uniref:hypothetical protein n=1 Tax=Spongiibacter taiwanensis TaxID=1748242 RepID=UPI002035CD54|nr:hypothetical protein [Spongiibacter taiwanensis]USA43553.1 hypothetical protein NCG89_01910 [Spongiibacter taiwanensis]
MIDQGDYQLAWQAYLGCGALAIALWIFVVRRLPNTFLRYWLSLAGIAFLFTPVRHPSAPELWVPGNVAGVLGLMTESIEVAMPVLLTLAIGQIVALVVAISLVLWLGGSKREAAGDAAEPAVRQPAGKPRQAPKTDSARKEPSFGAELESRD